MEETQSHIDSAKSTSNGPRNFTTRTNVLLILLLWAIVLGPFAVLYFMLSSANENLPDFTELENPKSNLATTVYTSDGVELGKYFNENRTHAKYHDLSDNLVNALIATEDIRFYEHSGIDGRALARVAKGVLTGASSQGGGSTITQQLAKMMFPRKKMSTWELVKRKFKEWILAAELEKRYTKQEILTMYLNKFDFLNLAVGINSAAQVYFSATPDTLQVQQAAMLVGMAKNPSLFNPLRREEKVKHRRSVVLSQMKKAGYLTQPKYDSLVEMPLGLRYSKVDHNIGVAPHFRETLRRSVSSLLKSKNSDDSYQYLNPETGLPYNIYSDGLTIYTTLDSRMQEYGEYAVKRHLAGYLQNAFDKNNKFWKNPPFSNDLNKQQIESIIWSAVKRTDRYKRLMQRKVKRKEIEKIFRTPVQMRIFSWDGEIDTTMSPRDSIIYYKGYLRSGLFSMDPKTGYVKAWVGGTNFKYFKLDHVNTRRQVGSTFKPFVYAAALRDGIINACDQFPNIEYCIEYKFNELLNRDWCPTNAGIPYDGEMTPISFALAASMNNITAKIMKETGPATVIDLIKDLGIDTSRIDAVPAMALGVFDLSLYEMVGAISAYANKGIYIKPIYFTRIVDKNGNIVFEAVPEATEALDENTAYDVLKLMEGVTNGVYHPTTKNKKTNRPLLGGTAIRIRGAQTKQRPYAGLKMPIAGKTGTTQNQSDGWFMGATPDLVTGVWVGAEDRAVRFRTLQLGMGTNTALPIWGYYMHKVIEDSTITISQEDFEPPLGRAVNLDCDQRNLLDDSDMDGSDDFENFDDL